MFARRLALSRLTVSLLLFVLFTAAAQGQPDEAVTIAAPSAAATLRTVEPPPPLEPPSRVDAVVMLTPPELQAPELPGPRLELAEALRLALTGHPALAALDYEVEAAEGRLVQGGFKPNPEFEAEISDFMGTAETRYFVRAVSGFGLSQIIELGRKRCARMAVAQREGETAEFEIERKRLDIMLEVSAAYYRTLAAQSRLTLAAEREQLAQQIYDTVQLRVEGGKAAQLELKRTGIELAAVRLEREDAEQAQRHALAGLLSLWAGQPGDYGSVAGELALPAEQPELAALIALLPDTPELRRFAAEEALRCARRDLAVAEGVPDITWSGGLERFEDTDSFGFKVGVSFQLPWNHRNEGKIMEAQSYLDQVEALRQTELRRAVRDLTELHGSLEAAHSRATRLERDLLPAAQETFELIQVGYRYGKFGLLDVLDAQRTLLDAKGRYLDAVTEYQQAAVQLERIVAQPLTMPGAAAGAAASAARLPTAPAAPTSDHTQPATKDHHHE
jgi:cobalt-zinc-cadmium efflux system outer membrane protein